MNLLACLFVFLFPLFSLADAVIFSGQDVKALKYNLDLFGRSKVMGLNVDPQSGSGVAAPLGSIGMDYLTGEVYFKDGPGNTDWLNVTDSITGSPNTFAGYNSAGVLGTITNWDITTINGAVGVANATTYTAPPDSGPVTNKIREWALSLVPDVSTNQQTVVGTQFDIHVDRDQLNNDFDGQVYGSVNVVTHEGGGNVGSLYGQQVQVGAGTGTTGGTVDNTYAIDIQTNAQSGHNVNNAFLVNGNFQGAGSVVNSTAINLNDNVDVSGNKSGIIYVNNGDTPNFNGLIVNNQGTSNGTTILSSLNSSGTDTGFTGLNMQTQNDTTGDYNGLLVNHSGDVSNNSKLLNINSSGAVTGDEVGSFVSLGGTAGTRAIYQGNNAGDVTSGNLFMLNFFNSGNVTNSASSLFGVNMANNGDADNIFLFNATSSGDSENARGMSLQLTGTHSSSATGIDIQMSGATVTPSLSNPAGRKTALQIDDGSINSSVAFKTISSNPNLVDSGNVLFNQFVIDDGDPISGTDVIGNNLAGGLVADDNHSPSPFGLGWSAVGLVGQLAVASGKTVDKASFMIAGGSVPVTSTGGTITDFSLYEAKGLVNAGGSLTVTNLYGYRYNNDLGFSPTNEWGLHIAGSSAESYIEKSLAIGTSSEKVTNSSVGLEIGGTTKAFRNAVMNTTQRDALTPLAGMQIYNSSLNAFQIYDGSSWVSPGGTGTVTSVALSAPSIFNVTGSPVTTSGTLTLDLANQTANTVFAGPSTGSPAAPTFRALVSDDLPVVPITKGGTGQTSQTAAFDALAPTTTKADLIVFNGSDNVRLPVGTNNHVLTADSVTAEGVKWAAVGSGSVFNYVAVSASSYNALATDTILNVNTSVNAVTINLPAAASNTGKVYEIRHVAGTNAVTIDPNSTETVCGASTFVVKSYLRIASDGSNWFGMDETCRVVPFVKVTSTASTAYSNGPTTWAMSTEVDDPYNLWASNTFTANKTGFWKFCASFAFNGIISNGQNVGIFVRLITDVSTWLLAETTSGDVNTVNTQNWWVGNCQTFHMDKGDTADFRIQTNTAANQTQRSASGYNWLTITWVGQSAGETTP